MCHMGKLRMLALGEGGSLTDSSYPKPMCPLSKKKPGLRLSYSDLSTKPSAGSTKESVSCLGWLGLH